MFYAISQRDFLSANKESDEPIECLLFDVNEDEESFVYSLKEPMEKTSIKRGYIAGIFYTKVQINDV